MDFSEIWNEMLQLAGNGKEFKTIGERTSFKPRVIGNKIEVDSKKAKDIHYITKESAKENYDIFISLPRHERYNTSHYKATWNKVYVLRFFKEILEDE